MGEKSARIVTSWPQSCCTWADAQLVTFDAKVTAVDPDGRRIALDRTAFYPTGGGQPHDTGQLAGLLVTEVRKEGEAVWHTTRCRRASPPGSRRW